MSNQIYNPAPIPNPIPAGKTIWDYKLGKYDPPAFEVYYGGEWVKMPMASPDTFKIITTTIVNAGRNAQAEVIGEQIGRTQSKIDGYKVPFLYAHEWTKILQMFKDKISRPVKYFDQEAGDFITRQMYVSDRTATAFAYKQDGSGRIEIWKDCELHMIDMGMIEARNTPGHNPQIP